MSSSNVVAVVNSNPDLVDLLRNAIEQAGFVVVIMHIADIRSGSVDLDGFFSQHDPKVIVYDVPPPYDRNWRFMDHVRATPGFRGRRFVLTTVNYKALRQVVGTDETVYEVIGESGDIGAIVAAVKEASKARSTR